MACSAATIFQRRFVLLAALLALGGCATAREGVQTETGPKPDDRLNATLWMQQAVEYKATAEAVYALAGKRLDEALADKSWTATPDVQAAGYENLPPAIILDADETVLDNSPYQAWMTATHSGYSDPTWNAWASAGEAGAVPGAVEFTNTAAAKGVKVFYVTNRDAFVEVGTVQNLFKLGFPIEATRDGKSDAAMMKNEKPDWTSAKGTRRATVAANYRVLLLLGDNFGDFVDSYKGSPAERQKVYDETVAHWGRDWLMLPNPAYGSWEDSAFGFNYGLSDEEKRRLKLNELAPWAGPGE